MGWGKVKAGLQRRADKSGPGQGVWLASLPAQLYLAQEPAVAPHCLPSQTSPSALTPGPCPMMQASLQQAGPQRGQAPSLPCIPAFPCSDTCDALLHHHRGLSEHHGAAEVRPDAPLSRKVALGLWFTWSPLSFHFYCTSRPSLSSAYGPLTPEQETKG